MSGMVMPRVVSHVVICLLVLIILVGFTTRSSAQTEELAKFERVLCGARVGVS